MIYYVCHSTPYYSHRTQKQKPQSITYEKRFKTTHVVIPCILRTTPFHSQLHPAVVMAIKNYSTIYLCVSGQEMDINYQLCHSPEQNGTIPLICTNIRYEAQTCVTLQLNTTTSSARRIRGHKFRRVSVHIYQVCHAVNPKRIFCINIYIYIFVLYLFAASLSNWTWNSYLSSNRFTLIHRVNALIASVTLIIISASRIVPWFS